MKKIIVHIIERNRTNTINIDERKTTLGDVVKGVADLRGISAENWGLDNHQRKKWEVYSPLLDKRKLVGENNEFWMYPDMSGCNPKVLQNMMSAVYIMLLILVIVFFIVFAEILFIVFAEILFKRGYL